MMSKHEGIINKRMEPYRNILRSKPRQAKKNYDRFIVLGDADPKVVEERIAQAMKKPTSKSRNPKPVVVEKASS